jgi:hypothetical protein
LARPRFTRRYNRASPKLSQQEFVMTTRHLNRPLLGMGVAAVLCLGIDAAAIAAKQPPQTTEDGLELKKAKNVDLLYVRPGATLSGYTKIMMDPVQVSFSKSWDPKDYGGTFGLKASEVEKIRNGIGELARETFVKVLDKGGYPEVKAADAGVLRMTVYILDLYPNAPDTMQAGRNRTFSAEAGHMTLGIELHDAVTGTLMARALDRGRSSDTGRFTWANSVSNRAEAERMLTGWANQMKDALDAAKAP